MNKQFILRGFFLLVLAAGLWTGIVYRDMITAENLEQWLVGLGFWAPVFFVLAWLVAPVAFLPGSPLTLVGGALFGPFWGAFYTIFGATGGATLAFLLARYLAGPWVEKKATGILGKVKVGVEHEGWRFIAFTRLVPLFPFNLLNFAFGLTNIPLRTYVVTSFLTMLPGTAGYTYLGYAGREFALGSDNSVRTVLIAVAVVAALVLLPMMIRRLQKNDGS